MCGTELPRQRQLGGIEIDRHHGTRARKSRALHGRKADSTAPDHHHGVAIGDGVEIERRARAGHHTAADQAGAIKRNLLRHHNRLLVRHDAVFAERTEIHQVLQAAAVAQHRPAVAVETSRFRPLAEISFAQNRRVAVAVKAMAAVRIPRQHNMVALANAACLRADLFHHTRRLMPEHDRHRKA